MELDSAIVMMIDALDAEQIRYMLVGSHSSNFYGIPRSSQDGDIVIEMASRSFSPLIRRLGADFEVDPQWSFESVTGTLRRIAKVAGTAYKIELFQLSQQPHDLERFRRRVKAQWHGRDVFLPTAEDVIITKVFWALHLSRGKDRDDVQAVIAVQRQKLDWNYIYHWADQHGTRQLLDEICRSIPSD